MTVDPEQVTEAHPATILDDLVHQRTRLGILAVLTEAGKAEFTYVRDTLDLTDGNLSRHVQVLSTEGLVHVDKGYEDNRPRTWLTITQDGRAALGQQVAAMKELVRRIEG